MFGYSDESGTPGRAAKTNDYYIISLVIFSSEESRDAAILAINELRNKLGLSEDYEFHCSRNTAKIQNSFIKLISKLDFSYITIAIKKNNNAKAVTNARMAELLVAQLKKHTKKLKIDMDINHVFYQNLRKITRKHGLNKITIRECRSKNHNLIQIADYIANISYKYIKDPIQADKWYRSIKNKCIEFILIAN